VKKLEFMTEAELRAFLNKMGGAIEVVAEYEGVEKPLFVLLLFNDPKVGQYVANCSRENIVEALRETANRLEGREDVTR
jgi:hypothetical protein